MPNVTPTFRHGRILERLRLEGEVRAGELAVEFGVTVMTIWRDLERLSEQGLLQRVHGGARAIHPPGMETGFEAKAAKNREEKQRIAAEAVRRFVRPGHVIALEGGTTVAAMVDFLPTNHVSIITNSLPVALRIRERRAALPVRILGGWLSGVSGNAVGPEAFAAAAAAKSSICFLGASAWVTGRGPMDPNPMEIEIKRALAPASARVVMLVDSQKFSKSSASILMHPRRIHALVTDATPPKPVARELKSFGIETIVA